MRQWLDCGAPQVTGLLLNLPEFDDLSDAALRDLVKAMRVERKPRDSVLFQEGEEGDKYFIVRAPPPPPPGRRLTGVRVNCRCHRQPLAAWQQRMAN